MSQPLLVAALELGVGGGGGRGAHPGEICVGHQVGIVPGVCGESGVIVIRHVLNVVEIVVAVVVEKFCFAPIEWWTLRRKRGAGDPKGGIHRMSGISGIHHSPSGHCRLGEEGTIRGERGPGGLLEALTIAFNRCLSFSFRHLSQPGSAFDRRRPRRLWTLLPFAQKSRLGNETLRLTMAEIRPFRTSRTDQMLVRSYLTIDAVNATDHAFFLQLRSTSCTRS